MKNKLVKLVKLGSALTRVYLLRRRPQAYGIRPSNSAVWTQSKSGSAQKQIPPTQSDGILFQIRSSAHKIFSLYKKLTKHKYREQTFTQAQQVFIKNGAKKLWTSWYLSRDLKSERAIKCDWYLKSTQKAFSVGNKCNCYLKSTHKDLSVNIECNCYLKSTQKDLSVSIV